MPAVIITDVSCLILLDKIDRLYILKDLFGSVILTPEVVEEFGKSLSEWIQVVAPNNTEVKEILQASLGKGESSSIALALENPESLIVLYDLKARRFAKSLGLPITGTLGLIIEAKLAGIIPSARELMESIQATNFRISDGLVKMVLGLTGEEE